MNPRTQKKPSQMSCPFFLNPRPNAPSKQRHSSNVKARTSLLMMLLLVVHCLLGHENAVAQEAQAETKQNTKTVTLIQNSKLPPPVLEMRQAILDAIADGNIEDMRTVLEWNELRPELGIKRDQDAIQTWREISSDGKGLEILAILAELLETTPARLPIGRDFENNHVYVWPYISELETDKLTPPQEIELYRLVPPQTAKSIVKSGKWTWYRLAIGADGTWHVFAKDP